MQYKCRVEVIDKKVFPEYQSAYLADPKSGTCPVIFKIERQDYKVVKIEGMGCEKCAGKVEDALSAVKNVDRVAVRLDKKWAEVFCDRANAPDDGALIKAVEAAGYEVVGID